MPDDPATYLAGRLRSLYPLSPEASLPELMEVCEARGARVLVRSGLTRRSAYYIPNRLPMIVIRPDSTARDLGHELYHHIIEDNASYGITYDWPDFLPGDPEGAAERFAALLCGEGA